MMTPDELLKEATPNGTGEWQRCPVCDGRGTHGCGFYDGPGPSLSVCSTRVVCRTCRGIGIICRPSTDYERLLQVEQAAKDIHTYADCIEAWGIHCHEHRGMWTDEDAMALGALMALRRLVEG